MNIKKWNWAEELVDRTGHHIQLSCRNNSKSDQLTPVSLIGPPTGNTFPVQFLLSGSTPAELEIIGKAKRELDFYLVEKAEQYPWEYALYHCNTASNLYSDVYWSMSAGVIQNWNGNEIRIARSKGGVIATTHPFNNLIHPNRIDWPPVEVVQKMYQSHHEKAFKELDCIAARHGLGFYCDLQSLHSEDAITWSVFGSLEYGEKVQKERWIKEFLNILSLAKVSYSDAEVFLWRRLPHPDTLVSGGPEIDFGIITRNSVILGEAKWQSCVDSSQGKNKDKDQIQLRGEFLQKYGHSFFPGKDIFAVIGLSLFPNAFQNTVPDGVEFREITWEQICSLPSHTQAEEVKRYYEWKKNYTNNQQAIIGETRIQIEGKNSGRKTQ